MHYAVLAIVEKPEELTKESVSAAVEAVLEPYYETKWDWFQIGGRWTGTFDGYDPDKDESTFETCNLCGGTGDRATWRKEPRDQQHPSGCNGCNGTGRTQKWPTDWKFRPQDCKPVTALTQADLDKFYAVCLSDGYGWKGGEEFEPWRTDDKFVKRDKPPLDWLVSEFGDKIAVVVDCHN